MATTTYGVNDALTVKLWAKKLAAEALKETFVGRFIGESASSLVHMKTDLAKGSGDRLTYGLRMQLSGAGVTENQVLEGNEESLTTYSDDLYINELAHAVRVRNEGTIDAQRVPFNLRTEAKDGLVDWYSDRIDQIFFNHLCGYTPETNAVYTGFNTITAPSSNRIIRAGTSNTDDNSLDDAATESMTLTLIDKAVEKAKTATPLIKPIRWEGDNYFVMFLHPYQVTSLRTNTSTGQWLDIQKAAMQGGKIADNPIFKGSLGMYNGVVLFESTRIRNGVTNAGVEKASTKRAVMCGAQSIALGFGAQYKGEQRFKWVEDMFDYERELGVSAQCVMGMKKTRFNSEDFGTIVVSTYAAAAS
jgi:N4-gp56 family major capsid protein